MLLFQKQAHCLPKIAGGKNRNDMKNSEIPQVRYIGELRRQCDACDKLSSANFLFFFCLSEHTQISASYNI